jgi:tetraacyldisaccharide 4'-kinase
MNSAGEIASLPVICIGNFTAGGAGKTPTALHVATLLIEAGEVPAFLSRGYGGTLKGPVRVMTQHTAREVGDEPLLLAQRALTIVSRDRPAGARLAQELGATVIVMDDGLQNPSLTKDLAIAVVDGETGLGNGKIIPSGPLRAPMNTQWPHVDAVIVIGDGEAGERVAEDAARKRVLRASIAPDAKSAATIRDQRVLAFAGIGRPEKFFSTLRACGANVVRKYPFPDHHPYSREQLEQLAQAAKQESLLLVTTEKDSARVGLAAEGIELIVLPVTLQLSTEDEGVLRTLLANVRGT